MYIIYFNVSISIKFKVKYNMIIDIIGSKTQKKK